MPEASATPATPQMSDSAATAQLIREITAEARSTGQSLVFDPEAPPETFDEPADGAPPPKPKPAAKPKDAKAPPEKEISEDGQAEDIPQDTEDAESTDQDGESTEQGTLDAEAVKRALAAEGGVDMLALAAALGVDPEKLKVSPAQHAVLRLQQSKAKKMVQQAHDLAKRLNDTYGDQVKARQAVATGDLNPAIEYIESTFGMSWNELNRAVAQLLQGKPVADLEQKRELVELRKKEAERKEAEKKAAESKAQEQKVADAKAWIASSIKGDKLATPELNQQLKDAGFPTITDLVFEEMQAGYSKGLTDPKKALERVKQKLTKQARALAATGLVGKPAPAKEKPLSTAKPRSNAQAGSAGNNIRPMTDKELREAVLKEAGLFR